MIEVSIVMPCLNEAETIEKVVKKAFSFLENNNIEGEVVIGDNGSTDQSQEIAMSLGARVIDVEEKGYGSASRFAIEASKGIFIITADTDDSHDLENLMPFIELLRSGQDFVMGNRFKGVKKKNAMPFLHRYVGNPVLTFIGNLFFNSNIGDFHCGLRGFTREAYNKMDLQTFGMEFASEIVVKATLNKLKISEVPTTVFPAGRTRKPHLRTFSDGWRHLRFLLMYSPKWLFLIPGVLCIVFGLFSSIFIFFKFWNINATWLAVTAGLFLIGFQFVFFFALVKIYAINSGLLRKNEGYSKLFHVFTLERGLLAGLIFLIIGIVLSIYTFNIPQELRIELIRYIIPITVSLTLGVQLVLFSFFFSILGINHQQN